MSARVTREEDAIKRARDKIEKRTGKTPEQLYEEKEKRITDVIQMKVPDRVPVFIRLHSFPNRYAGLPQSARFYDISAYRQAVIKTLEDFDPDVVRVSGGARSGLALDILGTKQLQWPGGTLRPDQNEQHAEEPTMNEDEYDLFISDPSDFILRYHIPRAYSALAAFSKLPPLRSLLSTVAVATQSPRFSTPEIVQAFEAIFKAGQDQAKFGRLEEEISTKLGFPPMEYRDGGAIAPFDTITDNLRGMQGIVMDMFRRPEKLIAAMERILEYNLVRMVPPDPGEKGKRRVSGAGSHWNSEAFLSKEQFEKFFWPTWKKSLMAAIDMGYIPVMGPEGKMDDRIECFLELPKGKAVFRNQSPLTDPARMKAILGGHIAFFAGVPPALMHFGSPQEVEEYCKDIIKICGKDGGLIFRSVGVGEEDAKPANLKAMIDSVKKYGRY
ncbi:hypothetical protein ACFLU1_06685 [Chloroflexota bacterium]